MDLDLPRKPMSSYLLFAKHMREKMKITNPGAGISEVMRVIGQEWAKLSPEEKRRFDEDAN